ncbi:MAG: hypothetical protein QM737_06445 [Ferruginibacter sp.]
MTKNHFLLFLFVFSTAVLTSCSKTKKDDHDNCVSYSNSAVEKVVGPNTGLINQDINLVVSYGLSSGCGQFDHFESIADGDTTIVNVVGKYNGCVCTAIYQVAEAPYVFKSSIAGTYFLKFLKNDNTMLVDTIVVQ